MKIILTVDEVKDAIRQEVANRMSLAKADLEGVSIQFVHKYSDGSGIDVENIYFHYVEIDLK